MTVYTIGTTVYKEPPTHETLNKLIETQTRRKEEQYPIQYKRRKEKKGIRHIYFYETPESYNVSGTSICSYSYLERTI
jgi:hypothetical protein